MDLGVHLVDLALWLLDEPVVGAVSSRLLSGGRPLRPDDDRVEDYAVATLDLGPSAVATLACSWRLPAGQDAVISVSVYGSEGGAALRNVGGSFFDFEAFHFRGTASEPVARPPDAWGGRAIVDWAARLAGGERFSVSEARSLETLAAALDAIYGRR